MMSVFQSCSDTSDATLLSASYCLYLKPVARLNISVQLPNVKLSGKSISNWEVMEQLRYYAAPDDFTSLKVSKSTLEVVRFEGEIENKCKLKSVLARLDGRPIKLSGFHESLKVRAAEAKPDFPTRHSWNSYFRDAKNMNEMKPGERPDTIYITNLPCKWFSTKSDDSKPSEYILRKVFEVFGEIRCVDIPMLDPFRTQMKAHISGIKMFSNNQNLIFEAYIQFKEYVCFVKMMDTLRDMKLLHIDSNGKSFSANIKIDFDKTKHLSDSNIRRRRLEREKLMSKEREREEKEQKAREEIEKKHAEERKRLEGEKAAKLERRRQREERRKAKHLERLKHREADEMNKKIATEERLLLMTQRRLESFRLLGELFSRLKVAKETERKKEEASYKKRQDRHNKKPSEITQDLDWKEKELREKLVKKYKQNDKINKSRVTRETSGEKEEDLELSDAEYTNDYNCGDERGYFQHGYTRGQWRGRFPRRRRGNMQYRGNMSYRGNRYTTMAFQYNRKPFCQKEPRWAHFPTRARGADEVFVTQPFMPPYYYESAVSDPYYKYFHKIALRDKRSPSRSSSRSRSKSNSRSSSSHRSSRSRSRSRRRARSYTRSKFRSPQKSKSTKRKISKNESHTSTNVNNEKKLEESLQNKDHEQDELMEGKSVEKPPSVHTWSRSPSRSRSLSWEKRKDEPSSSSKKSYTKHKKEKKKKDEKLKKDKKKCETNTTKRVSEKVSE